MQANVESREPDKKKKIRWIIAREGMIFLVFIATCIIVYYLWIFIHKLFNPNDSPSVVGISGLPAILILCPGYPAYLFIRFILWAIKALKKSNQDAVCGVM